MIYSCLCPPNASTECIGYLINGHVDYISPQNASDRRTFYGACAFEANAAKIPKAATVALRRASDHIRVGGTPATAVPVWQVPGYQRK